MRKKLVILFGVLLVLLLATTVASAGGGHSADQLKNWQCMIAGPNGWTHCFPPGGGSSASIQVKVFSADGSEFLGTEILIREDLYDRSGKGNGQPCSADDGEAYHFLGDPPYYACHHFETPHLP